MREMEKVKRCFGKYGNKPLEKEIWVKGEKKQVIGCTITCKDYLLCSECYWGWYFIVKQDRRFNKDLFIIKFMRKNDLRW